MPLVESRYAEALVGISEQCKAIGAFRQELQWIVNIYNSQEDFRNFLLSQKVDKNAKKDVVKNIFSGRIRSELLNLLMLLIDKGRVMLVPGIAKEFDRLADQKEKVLTMKIISAVPLEDEQVNKIKEKYRSMYNASSVKAELEIDNSLIGGVKVKIGDKVFDGTVKSQLEELRQMIVNS